MQPFKREEHVFSSPNFQEVVKDAVRFFNGTPVHALPLPERFKGAGVYALYYIGGHEVYQAIAQRNRLAYNLPMYVGKAVPEGWRQARETLDSMKVTSALSSRLKEHSNTVKKNPELALDDFRCRFMIMEDAEADLIGTVEAALIRYYRPLWNVAVDGFGNHDPGKGRYEQAKSEWDVLHPGRNWAEKCMGVPSHIDSIKSKIIKYAQKLEKESPTE